MKGETRYHIKIGNRTFQARNRKRAKRVFRKERAKHGGKVKLFEIRGS